MISNSLSKRFPQVQLEQGRMRAGLSVGIGSSAYRSTLWFQTKGEDSYMTGNVSQTRPEDRDLAPTKRGWRPEFRFAVVDSDRSMDLQVKVEESQLVIDNPGATLKIDLGDVADRSFEGNFRLVTVESDVKGDKTRTRVSVGQYVSDATTYEIRNGVLTELRA
jgi:hypothetical protein